MSRKLFVVVVVVVALLLVIGAGGYMIGRMAGLIHSGVIDTNRSTPPFTVYTGSYIVVIKAQNLGETSAKTTGTLAVKDSTTYELTGLSSAHVIVDGSNHYTLDTSGQWHKYPDAQQAGALPTYVAAFSIYLQNPSLLAPYTGAHDTGSGPCSSGICQIYTYTGAKYKEKVTIKVDSQHRINEITSVATTGIKLIATYDYTTPVNVTIPVNAQTIQAP